MVSAIDPAKPADGAPAVKAHLRANLQAAKTEIEALQNGKAEVGHNHILADVADAGALAGLDQVGSGEIASDALDGRAIDMQGQLLSRPGIRDFSETTAAPAVTGGSLTLDLEAASVFDATLTEDVTTLVLANAPAADKAGSVTLILKQDAIGGRTVTWPETIRWPGGTPPATSTVANAVDVLTFVTVDGRQLVRFSRREGLFLMLGASHAALLGCTPPVTRTYDVVVFAFDPDVVSYWKFENSGADEKGTRNASITGSPEPGVETIVDLDVNGECIAWPGSSGAFAEAAHRAAHKRAAGTIVVTFQHDSLGQKSTLIAADADAAAGGLSMEVQTDGSPRCFLRRQSDGVPVALVGQPGDVQPNEAYTLIFKWGPAGLSMALWNEDGLLVRRVTDPIGDGVSGTSPIRFGAWHTDTAHHDGPYGRVIWLKRRISDGEEVVLARAKTIFREGSAEIELTAIDAWGTDADSGGSINSSTGGTMPEITLDYDPTNHVFGASGGKADWDAQFRNSTLGSWSQQANGDFRFTPGSTAGTDEGEYRISDDGGATWSDWTPITIEVVARPPGPFFLVEDYGGSNQNKVESALSAASSAGGTATTLQRATVWDDVNNLSTGNAHLLGLRLKRSRSVHSSGDLCGQNVGSGKCSGWDGPQYFDRVLVPPLSANATRQQYVLCDIDGNSQEQALRQTSGDNPTPSSPCGTCYGDAVNNEHFNLQRQAGIIIRGSTGGSPSDRRKILFKRSRLRNTCGDGFDIAGSGDLQLYDSEFIDCFRGAWTINGGNTVVDAQRCRCLTENGDAPGIDYEVFSFGGTRQAVSTVTDCEINDDFDIRLEAGSDHTFTRCIVGPGLHWLAGEDSICTHIDGEVRFHNRGGGDGGNFPREAIRGVADDRFILEFNGTEFVAWGDPYQFHGSSRTPSNPDTFEIVITEWGAGNRRLEIRFINVVLSSHNLPNNATVRLLRSIQSFSTSTGIVRLDGVTIGSEYDLDAFQLNGQRLEYRNVTHEGFPVASIQQICPGAGQYVAI
jgi:hypothetical protein